MVQRIFQGVDAAHGATFGRVWRIIPPLLPSLGAVALFSCVVNVLTLGGSVYMLQVYDRVLVSRSVATLVTLTLLLIFVFAIQAAVDLVRSRLTVAIGRTVELHLRRPVLAAEIRAAAAGRGDVSPTRDLETVRAYLSGAGPKALLDLPWTPIFIGFAFLIHPVIGMTALSAVIFMLLLTLGVERLQVAPAATLGRLRAARRRRFETELRGAEAIVAMGYLSAVAERHEPEDRAIADAVELASNVSGGLGSVVKTLRYLIQSLILGVGAWLVIRGEVSPGAMIASSITVGRALAPIDAAIAYWRHAGDARKAAGRLISFLGAEGADEVQTQLPLPASSLTVETLTLATGTGAAPILTGVDFRLEAGDVLAVLGPSGAGKSTLLRALAGLMPPSDGLIRLDGAPADHYARERLGSTVGYVAQSVNLHDGTIAENISRLEANPSAERVLAAAHAAGIHDMILSLPAGYDTEIKDTGGFLSGGQRQRIALARALFGAPFLLLLDEANAHLDQEGAEAFARTVREASARGAVVVLVSHRPDALALASHVLVLGEGRQRAFGRRDEIVRISPRSERKISA